MQMGTKARRWTLGELHRLPEDGNKYEVLRGELFVTPAPSVAHEDLASVLGGILQWYVDRYRLGRVYRPRAVIQLSHSEVEPDLMVRPTPQARVRSWRQAPVPLLVVEILSDTTRARDQLHKRRLYLDIGISEYWIVDGEERVIRVVRPGEPDTVHSSSLTWQPAAAAEPLVVDVRDMFREALGE